jgi:hypothetical protein
MEALLGSMIIVQTVLLLGVLFGATQRLTALLAA